MVSSGHFPVPLVSSSGAPCQEQGTPAHLCPGACESSRDAQGPSCSSLLLMQMSFLVTRMIWDPDLHPELLPCWLESSGLPSSANQGPSWEVALWGEADSQQPLASSRQLSFAKATRSLFSP